jgi:hypothetical protein
MAYIVVSEGNRYLSDTTFVADIDLAVRYPSREVAKAAGDRVGGEYWAAWELGLWEIIEVPDKANNQHCRVAYRAEDLKHWSNDDERDDWTWLWYH